MRRHRTLSVSATLLALATLGAAAMPELPPRPAFQRVAEFLTPTEGSWPTDLALGPDGNIWFTEENANKIGMATPAGFVVAMHVLLEVAVVVPLEGPKLREPANVVDADASSPRDLV